MIGQLFTQDFLSAGIRETPAWQAISDAEVASERAIRWGILTNGAVWRLYYQGARSRSEEFLEFNIAGLLRVPGTQADLEFAADSLDLQLELRQTEIIVTLISPGRVDTDGLAASRAAVAASLKGDTPPNQPAPLSVEQSVATMVRVIADLDESYDGSHLDFQGNRIPW